MKFTHPCFLAIVASLGTSDGINKAEEVTVSMAIMGIHVAKLVFHLHGRGRYS